MKTETMTGPVDNVTQEPSAGRRPRGRAKRTLQPNCEVPVRDESNGSGQLSSANPRHVAAPAEPTQGHITDVTPKSSALRDTAGDGRGRDVTPNTIAVARAIFSIRSRHRERCFAIAQQIRLDNATRAYIRTCEGWRLDLPEPARNAIRDRAGEYFTQLDGGEVTDANRAYAVLVAAASQARSAFDSIRTSCEKMMVEAAKSLPAYEFVEGTKGAGALGLAIVVGEAGDLANYANPGKLWKRLGLAPGPCYSQLKEDGTSYIAKPKQRRSRIFTVGDSLLRQQNVYRELYLWRKRYEIANHPEWFKGVDAKGNPKTTREANFRAHRYAEKRFVKHLWMRWTGHTPLDVDVPAMPPLPEVKEK